MMQSNRRHRLAALAAVCLIPWTAALFLVVHPTWESPPAIPTRLALPSLTPSATLTMTPTSTSTATATATATPTATATAISSATPSDTPTLATRVLEITAVMPGVYIPPGPTAFPVGTILLPAPPAP